MRRRAFLLVFLLSLQTVWAAPLPVQLSGAFSQHDPRDATGPVAGIASGNGSWSSLGPKPIYAPSGITGPYGWGTPPYSGRVNAIAINTSNPSNIYVGAATGGVWKSLDGGATWSSLTDGQRSLAIGSITIAPDSRSLYVGTGDPRGSSYGAGLLKSTDGGKTWATLGSGVFANRSITRVIVNPADPARLLVSTTWGYCWCKAYSTLRYTTFQTSPGLGVYLSTDGGNSWTKTLASNSTVGIADLVSDSVNANIVYAGDNAGVVWKSADAGSTWNRLISNTNPALQGRVAVAVSSSSPGTVFAAIANSTGGLVGIYRYDTALHRLNDPPTPCSPLGYPVCNYALVLSVDPSNPSIIYFGDMNLYRSSDGGQSWTYLGGTITPSSVHTDQQTLVFLPGSSSTIFSGNDGGIWKSNDRGTTWTDLNSGLVISQFYSVAVSASPANIVVGGVQDDGCVKYSGQPTWSEIGIGDGYWSGVETTDANTLYCYTNTLWRSTDGGSTWARADNGIDTAEGGPGVYTGYIAQDPNNPGTLYFGSLHIYKSKNYGANWTAANGVSGPAYVNAIQVAPSNSSIVYLGDSYGFVKVSVDAGKSWQTIFGHYGTVTSLAVGSQNPYVVYVAYAGSGLFRVSYQSGSWQGTPLKSSPAFINVVRASPTLNAVYIGTDVGVYYSSDGGDSWAPLGTALPHSVVKDLIITASKQLFAATFGRGVWSLDISTISTTTTTISTYTTSSTTTTGYAATTTSSTTASTATSSSTPRTTSGAATTASSAITPTAGTAGIPEFPYQVLAVNIFAVLVIASYLVVRRHTFHGRHLQRPSS